MGYSIELYNLNWSDLRRAVASDDAQLLAAIKSKQGPRFSFDGGGVSRKEWDDALSGLILATAATEPSGSNSERLRDATPAQSLAVVALIRQLGEYTGNLRHSSAAGQMFREEFLAAAAPAALHTNLDLLNLLTLRPLIGLQHLNFPSWGGLTIAEVQALTAELDMRNLPHLQDSDQDSWFYELCDAMVYAKASSKDMVTLYL